VTGKKFTGTYCSNSDLETKCDLTVDFSSSGGKLKAVFSGEGALNGLSLENGEKVP
jgi:hypothetical protein